MLLAEAGIDPQADRAEPVAAEVIAQQEGFAKAGDTIAITGGMPFGVSGGTNLLRIAQLPSDRSADGGEGRKSS